MHLTVWRSVGLPNFLTGNAGWSILVFNYGSSQTAAADSGSAGCAVR
jgi:hypothetical protein